MTPLDHDHPVDREGVGTVGAQALRGFEVSAAIGEQLVLGQDGLDGGLVVGREIGVLVKLGLQPLDLLERFDEAGAFNTVTP